MFSSKVEENLPGTLRLRSQSTGSTLMSILPAVRLVHSATMRTRYQPFGSESHRRTMRVPTRPFGSTTSGLVLPGILRCPLFLRERRSRTSLSRMPVASPGLPLPGFNTWSNPQAMAGPGIRSVLLSGEIMQSVSFMFPGINRLNSSGSRGALFRDLVRSSGGRCPPSSARRKRGRTPR